MPKKQEKKAPLMSEKKQQQMLAEELVRRTHCRCSFRNFAFVVIKKALFREYRKLEYGSHWNNARANLTLTGP